MLKYSVVILIFLFVNKSSQLSIECEIESFNHKIGFLFTCDVKKIWNVETQRVQFVNGSNRFEVKGKFDVVKAIDFPRDGIDELNYFPSDLLSFFPNLISICILSSNNIAELSSSDLKPFRKLEQFHLIGSRITTIPGDLFKFNKKLRVVKFEYNKLLNNMDENLLDHLPRLQFLSFYGNKCTSDFDSSDEEDEYLYEARCPDKIKKLKKDLRIRCPPIKRKMIKIHQTNYFL